MEQKRQRMQELITILNEAGKAYYQNAEEIMSNLQYDKLYDELVELEKELGVTLANSPTVNVGYEVLSELPKERHEAFKGVFRRSKSVDFVEIRWSYYCIDLSRRSVAKSRHTWKWRSGRGYYK